MPRPGNLFPSRHALHCLSWRPLGSNQLVQGLSHDMLNDVTGITIGPQRYMRRQKRDPRERRNRPCISINLIGQSKSTRETSPIPTTSRRLPNSIGVASWHSNPCRLTNPRAIWRPSARITMSTTMRSAGGLGPDFPDGFVSLESTAHSRIVEALDVIEDVCSSFGSRSVVA